MKHIAVLPNRARVEAGLVAIFAQRKDLFRRLLGLFQLFRCGRIWIVHSVTSVFGSGFDLQFNYVRTGGGISQQTAVTWRMSRRMSQAKQKESME